MVSDWLHLLQMKAASAQEIKAGLKQLSEKEKEGFKEKSGGKSISQVVHELLNAYDPDTLDSFRREVEQNYAGEAPVLKDEKFNELASHLQDNAAKVFTGDLNFT